MRRIVVLVGLLLLLLALTPDRAAAATRCDVAFFHGFTGEAYASIDGVTNADGVTGYYREGDVISLRPGTYRFEWDDLTLEDVVVSCDDPRHGGATVTGGLVPPETDTAPTIDPQPAERLLPPIGAFLLVFGLAVGWMTLLRPRR